MKTLEQLEAEYEKCEKDLKYVEVAGTDEWGNWRSTKFEKQYDRLQAKIQRLDNQFQALRDKEGTGMEGWDPEEYEEYVKERYPKTWQKVLAKNK